MKYKNKLDKKNIIYITIVVLISILTLAGILYLEQYAFAIIFMIIIVLLLYTYINTIIFSFVPAINCKIYFL